MFGNGNGKEWEKPHGNPMGMGMGNWLQKWEWEWEAMGIDYMGMGGSGNVKCHSQSSLNDTTLRPYTARYFIHLDPHFYRLFFKTYDTDSLRQCQQFLFLALFCL